jgi:DNA (cytosine-5)-methyltransferase 1
MIEFYFKYNRRDFKKKSIQLAEELLLIFAHEGIKLSETNSIEICEEYKGHLSKDTFTLLNSIYFTIRENNGKDNPLLRKYLPELKTKPESDFLFADFFSGAGGLSQGLIDAGFSPAFVNDNYTCALETYYFNHSLSLDYFYNGDIRDLVENFSEYKHLFENIKIIVGGPPCQGFSTANRWNFEIEKDTQEKRFIEDKRNILYKYFVKLLGLIKPDFFIMENVKGMMRVEKQIEEDILKEADQGYSFVPLLVDAQCFDIPQSRKRYILVGGKDFMFNKQVEITINAKKDSKSKYKLKDALFGLPEIGTNPVKLNPNLENGINGYTINKLKVSQNEFLNEINNGKDISYLFNHKSRYNNENDLEIFKRLKPGEDSTASSIQDILKYKNREDIFKDKYKKLREDEICKTITSHMKYDCHMYIHPTQVRGLSPREADRIQTFPDDYLFRGALNDWYYQIGNAVPVKLAYVISKTIKKFYK